MLRYIVFFDNIQKIQKINGPLTKQKELAK